MSELITFSINKGPVYLWPGGAMELSTHYSLPNH